MGEKYRKVVEETLGREEHLWKKRLTPEDLEELRKMYEQRYLQKH